MDKAWLFVVVTLLGTVAGQMLLKHAVAQKGPIPQGIREASSYLLESLADPLVLLALALAFVGALAWIAALSRLSLSLAYPFMSLGFVLITLLSALLLRESVPPLRWVGMGFLFLGLLLVSRG